jgi:hypothetical protein
MTVIKSIILSAWFQLILLGFIFFLYSRRVRTRGYALGWMLGLFFIFSYVALDPPQTLQLGAYDDELNVSQILVTGFSGIFVSIAMTTTSHIFHNSRIQRAVTAAAITGGLIAAMFLQLVAEPEIRLMVSLFVLSFGMTALTTNIITSRTRRSNIPYEKIDYTTNVKTDNSG